VSQPTEKPSNGNPPAKWEPRIVAFFCNWCTYTAADLAGVSRMKQPPTSGSSGHVLRTRRPPVRPGGLRQRRRRCLDRRLSFGDCHYVEETTRRLGGSDAPAGPREMGIEADRFRLEWISASEGERSNW